jgi:DNA adenine methylase
VSDQLRAPFPAFGGKRDIAAAVWERLGSPKQYIEPFCFSAAVLLSAPAPASLEVIGDLNGFVANFWRAVVNQSQEVARWADYPVSHVDLGARHPWLLEQRDRIAAEMQDPNWPGDAKVAGWWLWGQCSWIGSGWCEWQRKDSARQRRREGHPGERTDSEVTSAGMGIQASGQIPHVSDAGRGIQASGQIPHVGNADPIFWTSGGLTASVWLAKLAARLERVRVVHGEWSRCLNNHYGGDETAVFLDPPYLNYEELYRVAPVAKEVEAWCRENAGLRLALCGHRGDYDLPGWDVLEWERKRLTYSGDGTKATEAIWFSPACIKPRKVEQMSMFGDNRRTA